MTKLDARTIVDFEAAGDRLAKLPPDLVLEPQTPSVLQAMARLDRVGKRAC